MHSQNMPCLQHSVWVITASLDEALGIKHRC
ncbi:hypothetical protein VCB_001376 [Vibrio cholerae TMA 21]|nr:hypothetical protein VCB_001376 [Vibrio cholerae TMA 21]